AYTTDGWTDSNGERRDGWLKEQEQPRQWKWRTVSIYRRSLERLGEEFGDLKLDEIRPRHITDFVRRQREKEHAPGKKYAPATVNLDVSVLHDVLDTAR